MTFKLILVPLSGHHGPSDPESLEVPALEAAFRAGQAFDARVHVFLIDAPIDNAKQLPWWIPDYEVGQVIESLKATDARRRENAMKAFHSTVERLNVPVASEDIGPGFAVQFLEGVGDVSQQLSNRGKLADLIVTAHPPADWETSNPLMLEIALRETGRPVLIAPMSGTTAIGEHVAIAWNGSSEAARAVAMCLDVLHLANKVTVLSVRENGDVVPSGQELADYLGIHNIDAATITIDGSARSAGAHLLAEVERADADLMIMGAYTRSRGQRLIFGGATDHILRTATVPVIMVD